MKKRKEQYLKAKIVIHKEEKKITVIASDETLDRHGDVLPIESWDLTKFLTAPRMLVDHDHSVASIVGKWENVRIEGKKLLMDANFHDFTDLAKAVKQMVEEGYLNTVSVGFIYNGPEGDGQRPTFELIETSWVTVPANPSARITESLKSAMEKSLSAEEEQKVKEFAGETKEGDEEEGEVDEGDEGADAEPKIDPETGEPIIPEEEDEDEEIPEHDNDDEEVLSIGSLVEFKEAEAKLVEDGKVLVSVAFLKQLVADSEQLQTLTDKGLEVIRAKKAAELIRLSMKEAAGQLSHALREANKTRS